VVDVVQASASDGAWLDGSREAAGHQSGHELATVLPAHGAGELAVLPLEKTSGVDHDGHQELALPQRHTVLAQSGHPADADAVEGSVGRVFVGHRNSSIPRGRGPDRPVAVVILEELLVLALQVLLENDASNLEVRVLVSKTGFFLTKRRVEIRVVVDFP
jgi:hypothetical protein